MGRFCGHTVLLPSMDSEFPSQTATSLHVLSKLSRKFRRSWFVPVATRLLLLSSLSASCCKTRSRWWEWRQVDAFERPTLPQPEAGRLVELASRSSFVWLVARLSFSCLRFASLSTTDSLRISSSLSFGTLDRMETAASRITTISLTLTASDVRSSCIIGSNSAFLRCDKAAASLPPPPPIDDAPLASRLHLCTDLPPRARGCHVTRQPAASDHGAPPSMPAAVFSLGQYQTANQCAEDEGRDSKVDDARELSRVARRRRLSSSEPPSNFNARSVPCS